MPPWLNSVSTMTMVPESGPITCTIRSASSLDMRYHVALSFQTPSYLSLQPFSTQVGLMSSPQYHHCTTGVTPLAFAVWSCSLMPPHPYFSFWFQDPTQRLPYDTGMPI